MSKLARKSRKEKVGLKRMTTFIILADGKT